jgi:hypothetical protein
MRDEDCCRVCILTAHRGWHSPGRFNSVQLNKVEEVVKMERDQNRN